MCGILGFNWKDEVLAKNIGKLLRHRGPDGEGYLIEDNLSLGHRRLSIIDLSEKGKQPMCDERKRYWITYNGEIFNFKEIRNDLLGKGYTFKSKTDTEVLLLGYQEYGAKILEKLNGQFAFCIYDKQDQTLFLARDRIGINPLYYYFDGKRFVFGSELKVILKSGVPLKINSFAKDHFMVFGHCPRKQSIIENAYKLEPGHYMVFNLKNNKIETCKKYWNIKFSHRIRSEKNAVLQIRELLSDSVRIRLISDVPVGAFLSGGLDSSAVVAHICKYKKNLNTFSVKFDRDDFDESKYGELISRKFGTKHHVVTFNANEVKKLLDKLAFHYDEPFADPSMIPTFLVSQIARRNVTVSLSGDGGDELFGGYTAYKHYRFMQLARLYPKQINEFFYRVLGSSQINKYILAYFDIGKTDKKYARIMSYLSTDEAFELITTAPEKLYAAYERFSAKHWLNNAIINDLHNYLPDDILTKVDRASLGNSLESRPPLLDHRLIELSANIDPKLKLKVNVGKYILKKAMEGILPKEIIYRKKMGFGVPLSHYFMKELQDLLQEVTSKELKEIKSPQKIYKYKQNDRLLWSLLIYRLWHKKWIKG